MVKIEQKVKANLLPSWSILATFQLFKDGSKIKAKHYRIIFNLSYRGYRPFWTIFKNSKKWRKSSKK